MDSEQNWTTKYEPYSKRKRSKESNTIRTVNTSKNIARKNLNKNKKTKNKNTKLRIANNKNTKIRAMNMKIRTRKNRRKYKSQKKIREKEDDCIRLALRQWNLQWRFQIEGLMKNEKETTPSEFKIWFWFRVFLIGLAHENAIHILHETGRVF